MGVLSKMAARVEASAARLRDRALKSAGIVTSGEVYKLRIALANERAQSSKRKTASGVPMQSGRFMYEGLREFGTDLLHETVDAMESDPRIKAQLNENQLPIKTGRMDIVPASDKPIDKDIAEFVGAVLLRKPSEKYGSEFWSAQTPYSRLTEELDALRVGRAIFIPSWRRVDSKIVYDRFGWIEPQSVDRYNGWKLADDSDDVVSIRRRFQLPSGQWVDGELIPAEQLRIFVWDMKGARYDGRSFLRSLYAPWWRKDQLARWGLSAAQKLASPIPVLHYPPGWGDDEQANGLDLVMSARGTASVDAFGFFPKDSDGVQADLEYVGGDIGEIDRVGSLMDRENQEIHQGGATTSKGLGETGTGNRALGEDMSADEDTQRQAIALWLTDGENFGTRNLEGWIGPLVRFNFPGVKQHPQIAVSRIGPNEDRSTIKPMIELWSADVPIEVRKAGTERLGYKFTDDVYEEWDEKKAEAAKAMQALKAPAPPKSKAPGAADDAPEPDAEVDAVALGAVPAVIQERIAELLAPIPGGTGPGLRGPSVIEQRYCNMAEVAATFKSAELKAHQALRVMRDDMIRELMGRLRGGKIVGRNLESQRRSAYRGRAKGAQKLKDIYNEAGVTGQKHVDEELARQEDQA